MFELFIRGRHVLKGVGVAPGLFLSRKNSSLLSHRSSSSHFSCDPVICHFLLYSSVLLTDSLISFLCFRQWLEDALRENEPDSSFIFLVGTKKDLVVSKLNPDKEIGFLLVPRMISLTSSTQCCCDKSLEEKT